MYNPVVISHPKKHTLSTFSWLQGNLYPGYGLLSLGPSINGKMPEHTLQACPLLSQMIVYFVYIGLFIVTLFWVWMSPKRVKRIQDIEYIQLPRYQSETETEMATDESGNHEARLGWRIKNFTLRILSIVAFVLILDLILLILF